MYSHYTSLYGLIGYPLGHSFSQDYFNHKFEAEGIDARYVNFEIRSVDRLYELIETHPNLRGINVTIPYKEQVIPLLDSLDAEAEAIGAVNVISIKPRHGGGRPVLTGHNSDIIGFTRSIEPLLPDNATRALVLGTGGASKAVCRGLRNLGIEPQLVSRSARPGIITYSDITPEVIADHLVIVNTTPLGMYPHVDECPDLPYGSLTHEHLCYDLLYNPDTTLFMRRSALSGATVKNGLEMLLLQAFAAWKFWQKDLL